MRRGTRDTMSKGHTLSGPRPVGARPQGTGFLRGARIEQPARIEQAAQIGQAGYSHNGSTRNQAAWRETGEVRRTGRKTPLERPGAEAMMVG